MRHVTVIATNAVFAWLPNIHDRYHCSARRACDWGEAKGGDVSALDVYLFLDTEQAFQPPTCPACAALLDLALEMRGAP